MFGRAKEPFLRRFLRLEHGIPSHDAFSNLFPGAGPGGLGEGHGGAGRRGSAAVVSGGGDYVLALKGNQETLHDDVRL